MSQFEFHAAKEDGDSEKIGDIHEFAKYLARVVESTMLQQQEALLMLQNSLAAYKEEVKLSQAKMQLVVAKEVNGMKKLLHQRLPNPTDTGEPKGTANMATQTEAFQDDPLDPGLDMGIDSAAPEQQEGVNAALQEMPEAEAILHTDFDVVEPEEPEDSSIGFGDEDGDYGWPALQDEELETKPTLGMQGIISEHRHLKQVPRLPCHSMEEVEAVMEDNKRRKELTKQCRGLKTVKLFRHVFQRVISPDIWLYIHLPSSSHIHGSDPSKMLLPLSFVDWLLTLYSEACVREKITNCEESFKHRLLLFLCNLRRSSRKKRTFRRPGARPPASAASRASAGSHRSKAHRILYDHPPPSYVEEEEAFHAEVACE